MTLFEARNWKLDHELGRMGAFEYDWLYRSTVLSCLASRCDPDDVAKTRIGRELINKLWTGKLSTSSFRFELSKIGRIGGWGAVCEAKMGEWRRRLDERGQRFYA